MTDPATSQRTTQLVGVAVAASGLAHFAATDQLVPWMRSGFPSHTTTFIRINGAIETAIGLALLHPATRPGVRYAVPAYVAYLTAAAIGSRAAAGR